MQSSFLSSSSSPHDAKLPWHPLVWSKVLLPNHIPLPSLPHQRLLIFGGDDHSLKTGFLPLYSDRRVFDGFSSVTAALLQTPRCIVHVRLTAQNVEREWASAHARALWSSGHGILYCSMPIDYLYTTLPDTMSTPQLYCIPASTGFIVGPAQLISKTYNTPLPSEHQVFKSPHKSSMLLFDSSLRRWYWAKDPVSSVPELLHPTFPSRHAFLLHVCYEMSKEMDAVFLNIFRHRLTTLLTLPKADDLAKPFYVSANLLANAMLVPLPRTHPAYACSPPEMQCVFGSVCGVYLSRGLLSRLAVRDSLLTIEVYSCVPNINTASSSSSSSSLPGGGASSTFMPALIPNTPSPMDDDALLLSQEVDIDLDQLSPDS